MKGFNEAEASLPRNTKLRPAHSPAAWPASMRPRQACLGIRFFGREKKMKTKASMRPRQACLGILAMGTTSNWATRRFNEAEASLPRNTASRRRG